MIEQNLARVTLLLGKQITNLEANNLLSIEDQANLSEIISNLAMATVSLRQALLFKKGEEWRSE